MIAEHQIGSGHSEGQCRHVPPRKGRSHQRFALVGTEGTDPARLRQALRRVGPAQPLRHRKAKVCLHFIFFIIIIFFIFFKLLLLFIFFIF